MKKFKSKPIVVEPDPLEKVISCIKKENSYGAIKFMLERMDPIQRGVFATSMLSKSKYKGYRMAMNRFVELIQQCQADKNLAPLEEFRKQLTFDMSDEHMYDFSGCRAYIIDDMLHNNYTYSLNAILLLTMGMHEFTDVESLLGTESFKEISNKLKPVAADLAFLLWPEALGLKVLFGGK